MRALLVSRPMDSLRRIDELEGDIQRIKEHLRNTREFEVRHALLRLLDVISTSLKEERNYFKYKRVVDRYGL